MGSFSIISLLYIFIGIRVVSDLVKHWRVTWDHSFTQHDRARVDQAAFFLLIPISVALHEFGHAALITVFGKRVLDFGFYVFAGWVSYNPFGLSAVQNTLIAGAGSFVNLILCVLALTVVLFKKPAMRPAFNELLIQFCFLSGINAFIFYPVMDLLSGMNGDWKQMYSSETRWLAMLIIAMQVAIIGAGVWLIRNRAMADRLAALSGAPKGFHRGVLGGLKPIDDGASHPTMRVDRHPMDEAIARVASGWPSPVSVQRRSFGGESHGIVSWDNHVLAVRAHESGRTDIVTVDQRESNEQPTFIPLANFTRAPSADELTLALRLAMERTESLLSSDKDAHHAHAD